MHDYEEYYNNAMREIRRLREVAREYDHFFRKVKKAFDEKNWRMLEEAIES